MKSSQLKLITQNSPVCVQRTGRKPKTLLLLAFALLTLWACPKPEPLDPPRDTSINLELLDEWTTSVTLKISVEDTSEAWDFALSRNGSIVHEGRVNGSDTILVDEGLIPNTSYNYMTYFVEDGNVKDSSLVVNTTTMDTTSHNFTWVIDTLGGYGSYLNDVAIVDENNIWVVGALSIPDSAGWNGPGTTNYNAAHWDGNEWEMIGIYSNTLELHSIQYFSEDDIWVTDICSPIHWDGSEWTLYHIQDMGLDACAGNAMWGTSSSNMYFVGNRGSIVHYDGSEFVKIDCDVDTDYRDITGTPDGKHVFIVGDPSARPGEEVLLHINGNTLNWERVSFPFNEQGVTELPNFWTIDIFKDEIFIPTHLKGLWIYNYISQQSILHTDVPHLERLYKSINVIAENDMFLGGSKFDYIHFNGQSYEQNDDNYNSSNIMRGGDYNGNIAVMVAESGPVRALVARGYRE